MAEGWISSLGRENENMKVTQITSLQVDPASATHRQTEKQFYDEINYHRADNLTKKMMDSGLITAEERSEIMSEARKIFTPFMAELL